jgi:hypothetical protein
MLSDYNEMQEMLDIVLDYAGDRRFQIHPVNNNAIIKTVGKRKIDRVAEKQNTVSRPYRILGSRRLGRFCMMFLGSAHLCHQLLFLLMSKAFS